MFVDRLFIWKFVLSKLRLFAKGLGIKLGITAERQVRISGMPEDGSVNLSPNRQEALFSILVLGLLF